jgi:peptidoglycan/xylan/chitin deacetylase (PgdA/CDA1 family)
MRRSFAAYVLAASIAAIGVAQAADCAGNPNALGVSRTIVLDPTQHPRLGTLQYDESLPLNDHEVVLTFDDGPLQPYTNRVLDALAAECTKATFFLVGRMALGYPHVVQREYSEGHTIATHSQNHPFTFAKMSVDQASKEIEDGFDSVRSVLGDPNAVAPFFRIPGLLRQDAVEDYLSSRHYATFSLDFLADDWTHISAKEITRRALQRIEARGRGILLLHDIQPATAQALPTLLAELKRRGYKIVQVVPATPDRAATVADASEWLQSHHSHQSWARVVAVGSDTALPSLGVPSPQSLGVTERPGQIVALGLLANADSGGLPYRSPWPSQASYPVPADNEVLPIPADQDFIYLPIRPTAAPRAADRKGLHKKWTVVARPAGSPGGAKPQSVSKASVPAAPPRPTRPVGHQLSLSKPTASL